MKIAIVGNGKLSKNYGKQIDKCDLVIRFNQATTKGFEELIGTRTDILALAGETSLSYIIVANKLDRSILRKCDHSIFYGFKKNKDYEKRLIEIAKKDIKFEYINFENYYYLVNLIGINNFNIKNPSTGINIICEIFWKYNLSIKDDKLFVYGVDCFKSGHYFNNEKRNNHEFHDLDIEKQIINYLKKLKNIKFYN
jgi:hypothetical protein